jgi:hypothetical protein
MLQLLIALCSHSQLVRLRGDSLPGIEEGLRSMLAGAHARVTWRTGGSLLAACGPEAGPAADLALRVLGSLRAQRELLFGFSLVLEDLPAAPDDGEARRLTDEALALVPEEELWVSAAAAGRFDGVLDTRPHGGLYRVVGQVRGPTPAAGPAAAPGSGPAAEPAASPARAAGSISWTRETLVERCLDLLAHRLNDGESRAVLFLHGPAGAGKTTLLAESARRLGCVGPASPLRAYALFRRRTPLHPFLNSLDPGFLPRDRRRGARPDRHGFFPCVPALRESVGAPSGTVPRARDRGVRGR